MVSNFLPGILLAAVVLTGGVKCENVQAVPGMSIGGIDMDILLKMLPQLLKDLPIIKFFNFTSDIQISESCKNATGIWGESLLNPTDDNLWAIRMIDATGKIPSGLLEGGLSMFGSFDECINIKADPSSWNKDPKMPTYDSPIQGQYCAVGLDMVSSQKPNVSKADVNGGLAPLKGMAASLFRLDLCVPDACTEDDINAVFTEYLTMKNLGLKPSAFNCQVDKPTKLEGCQIAAIVIFSILGLLLFSGTFLDIGLELWDHFLIKGIAKEYQGIRWVQALLSFSMYRNGLKLLDTRQSPDSLTAVNGIRFLSMAWVIVGHTYNFINIGYLGNLLTLMDVIGEFHFQVIANATISVDSFFFLSGLLLSYLTIRELRKMGGVTKKFIGMLYFHRFWRLTPAVILFIMLIFLWPLIFSGPLWAQNVVPQYENCKQNWWANLLYIQNFVTTSKPCLGYTWYLANDMQFYIISPIFLIALYMNRRIGLAMNGLLLLVSLVTSGILANVKHIIPTSLASPAVPSKDNQTYSMDVYVKPWCRIGPFCIGIFVGYFLSCKRNYKIPKLVKAGLWCAAIVCNVSVLYATYPWNGGTMPNPDVGYLYMTVHRTVWSLGLGWLTFACAIGDGGIINRILSWTPFVFLGRLSFMAYLIHPFVIITFAGMLRERLIYTHFLYVVLFLGFMVISLGISFVLSLAFESPFVALEKVLFAKPKHPQKKPEPEPQPPMASVNEVVVEGQDNPGYDPDAKLTEL